MDLPLKQLCPVWSCHRYVCIVQKAYQDTDSVVSTVTTKVKGYAIINGSAHIHGPHLGDVADLVIPSQVH